MSDRRKKRVLVIHYSQTGQLNRVVKSVASPISGDDIELDFLELKPVHPYPFPWPLIRFINAFPESVHEVPCALEPIPESYFKDYDLVMLGYQVWYLAPSIPISSFLQSREAERLLKDKPVITVIACRGMWLLAQERVKRHLQRLNAKLVGNVALIDEGGSGFSFLSTPLWMFSGSKGPYRFGIPAAGVGEKDIEAAQRFGHAIKQYLDRDIPLNTDVFKGLGAVAINTNQVASEKIATRSFKIWGKLFLLFGGPEHPARKVLAVIYIAFLVLMILTVVPLNYFIKRALNPLFKSHNAKMREYYSRPSGEARFEND